MHGGEHDAEEASGGHGEGEAAGAEAAVCHGQAILFFLVCGWGESSGRGP